MSRSVYQIFESFLREKFIGWRTSRHVHWGYVVAEDHVHLPSVGVNIELSEYQRWLRAGHDHGDEDEHV